MLTGPCPCPPCRPLSAQQLKCPHRPGTLPFWSLLFLPRCFLCSAGHRPAYASPPRISTCQSTQGILCPRAGDCVPGSPGVGFEEVSIPLTGQAQSIVPSKASERIARTIMRLSNTSVRTSTSSLFRRTQRTTSASPPVPTSQDRKRLGTILLPLLWTERYNSISPASSSRPSSPASAVSGAVPEVLLPKTVKGHRPGVGLVWTTNVALSARRCNEWHGRRSGLGSWESTYLRKSAMQHRQRT